MRGFNHTYNHSHTDLSVHWVHKDIADDIELIARKKEAAKRCLQFVETADWCSHGFPNYRNISIIEPAAATR